MLVGTDTCLCVVFVWKETGVRGGNPPVRLGDHTSIRRCLSNPWVAVLFSLKQGHYKNIIC